jgi:hypothetical protein
MICPMLIGTSMVQIFTNLYFIQHKRIANIYLISAYAIYIYLIFYAQIVGYEAVFTKSNGVVLPNYLDILIHIDFIFFLRGTARKKGLRTCKNKFESGLPILNIYGNCLFRLSYAFRMAFFAAHNYRNCSEFVQI